MKFGVAALKILIVMMALGVMFTGCCSIGRCHDCSKMPESKCMLHSNAGPGGG